MTDATASLIARSIERLFAGVGNAERLRVEGGTFDQPLWDQIANGGFHSLMASEPAGGFGLQWTDVYPVMRGIGYWQVPVPLAETIVALLLASLAGFQPVDGPMTIGEEGVGDALAVTGGGDASRISGTLRNVPWARHAKSAVLSLASRQLAHVELGPGVTFEHAENHAGLPTDTLIFADTPLLGLAPNPLALERPVRTLGALARSAMIVGALESALEQAVRYAGERVQFGKPIAKYQAIQQSLALMASDVAAARVATLVAFADAPDAGRPECGPTRFSVVVAKIRASEAATRGAAIAHQVHGAIGFTHEHSLHFATRRLLAWRGEYGSDAAWSIDLGRAAIAAGGAAFWRSLTAKSLFESDGTN